jgi:hypothetical protein
MLAALKCYRKTCIPVLLLRANNLRFGAEKTPDDNFRKSHGHLDELRTARGPAPNSLLPVTIVALVNGLPLKVASCSSCYRRDALDDRNWLGLVPVHRLNACVKEPISRYPRSHAISEIGSSRSLR